jgi:hypothetical protein
MHVVMSDGTELGTGPGQVVTPPSGHDGWVVGNEPVVIVDRLGVRNYAKKSPGGRLWLWVVQKHLDNRTARMVHSARSDSEGITMSSRQTAAYYFWFSFPGVCPLGSRRRMS